MTNSLNQKESFEIFGEKTHFYQKFRKFWMFFKTPFRLLGIQVYRKRNTFVKILFLKPE